MTRRTTLIFGFLGFLSGIAGSILLRDFQEHGVRLLWVGYLFPVAIVLSALATGPNRNRLHAKLGSPPFLLLLVLQWPVTLLAAFGAFFGLATVLSTFSFYWVWFCFFIALLAFGVFVYFIGRELGEGLGGFRWLLAANLVTFGTLAIAYKGSLQQNATWADLSAGAFFGVLFGPLSAINAAWIGWRATSTGSEGESKTRDIT